MRQVAASKCREMKKRWTMVKTEVQRSGLLSFLEGHSKTDEVIKGEKRKLLSQLSVEDASQEYDAEHICN